MLRQANLTAIRKTLEERLSKIDLERLRVTFEDAGPLPAAAIMRVDGVELRLEKDEFDGYWTVATNEGEPRLLSRLNENELGPAMLDALERSIEQNLQ